MSLSFEVSKSKLPYQRLVTTQNGKSERILQHGICPVLESCRRCPLLDTSYPKQLLQKTQKTKDFFKKLGEFFSHVSVKDCVEAPEKLAYRHSVHLMISEEIVKKSDRSEKRRISIGFYQSKQKRVIDIGRCPVQNLQLNHIVAWLRTGIRIHKVSIVSKSNQNGILDSVILTSTHDGKQIFVCFIVSKLHAPSLRALSCDISSKFSNVRGIFMRTRDDTDNKNLKILAGHMTLKEKCLGIERERTFKDFFPANPSMTAKMLKRILELQSIYEKKYKISFVSSNPYISSVVKSSTLEESLSSNNEMICYVSSLSQSTAKAFQLFESSGYSVLFVEPFDMLPATEYIETITLFLKRS